MRALAATGRLACCLHGKAEVVAAFHRKLRDGAINKTDLQALVNQFEAEDDANAFQWLAFSPLVIGRIVRVYLTLPSNLILRSADALHLACAAEGDFKEIYSNDARLLTAAPFFDLRAINIL